MQLTPTLTMSKPDEPTRAPSWLTRPLGLGLTPAGLLLAGIMLAAGALYFVNLSAIGDANLYYTAAVKSMLQSWHNFFFVAAEPGGSVTVDKPPLGLWIEAGFAYVLGVNGTAVSLPNILAALASLPLLYYLVKRWFGPAAGLTAALVLAAAPVAVAAARNNTMDWLLVCALLLAAACFVQAADTGRRRWLWLGAITVGIAFNIKMLQAFLPLPAFYALYLFGAPAAWRAKLVNLALATALLTGVSLAWAVAVDLTPADQRPYIGSSTNNTVMELIIGHNGLNRLVGGAGRADGNRPPLYQPGQPPAGQPGQPPAGQFGQPPAGQPGQPPAGAPGGAGEVGTPGLLRFFQTPLAKEMSWLLPLGLGALALAALGARPRFPLSNWHKGVILWGGWLVTCLVFFSAASFFHAYYMVMLAPALGAVLGLGVARLWALFRERRWLALGLLAGAAVLTLVFQFYLAGQLGVSAWWWPAAAGGALLGLGLLAVGRAPRLGLGLVILALAATPLIWSAYTTLESAPNVNLPAAYTAAAGPGAPANADGQRRNVDQKLLSYLEANTQGVKYLMAASSANQGDGYVLATGRPVLFMGGFNGADPVVTAEDLAQLVAAGDLRYVWTGGGGGPGPQNNGGGQAALQTWLRASCTVVSGFGAAAGPAGNSAPTLYQCAP